LFRQAPQPMLMFDEQQCVLQSNQNARRLFGYDEAGFRGLPLSHLLPVDIRGHHQGLASDYLQEPTAKDMSGGRQVRAVRSNGDEFFAEIGLVPLQDNGRARVLAGITDISARLAAERANHDALREKEVLLKEIHHRVKNNLQIISSLLTMQIDRSAADDVRYALQESVYRIRSMGLIHELLYGVESLDSLDFAAYATALVQRLRTTFGERVTIVMDTHPVSVTIDQAVPLGLIVNELLTNAFKHALQSRGGEAAMVKVGVSRQADILHLLIADNGPGFPAGFVMEQTNTLGMQLVRSLKRQLRAQISFSSGPGARIALDVPLDVT
jgi:PAS domain S-box-containing protein